MLLLPTVSLLLVAGALAGPAQHADSLQKKSQDYRATLQDYYSQLKSLLPAADFATLNSDPIPLSRNSATLAPGLYRLTSPRFPFRYPNNFDGTLTLVGDQGQDISISCLYSIQFSSSCTLDYLQINTETRCGIGRVSLTSAELVIRFVSNSFIRRRGFICLILVPQA